MKQWCWYWKKHDNTQKNGKDAVYTHNYIHVYTWATIQYLSTRTCGGELVQWPTKPICRWLANETNSSLVHMPLTANKTRLCKNQQKVKDWWWLYANIHTYKTHNNIEGNNWHTHTHSTNMQQRRIIIIYNTHTHTHTTQRLTQTVKRAMGQGDLSARKEGGCFVECSISNLMYAVQGKLVVVEYTHIYWTLQVLNWRRHRKPWWQGSEWMDGWMNEQKAA